MRRSSLCLRLARLVMLAALSLAFWQVSTAQQNPPLPPSVQKVLKGHDETVYATAYTPDGKYILTASFDNTIRLWDAKSGKEIKVYEGDKAHKDLVLTLAVSKDGRYFATGSQDRKALVWDIPSETHVRAFTHADAVNAVTLSNDGKMLASAGKDGLVKLWNPADGKELKALKGHTGAVTGVAFSADGKTIGSCGVDQTLRFWNTADGKDLGFVFGHAAPATGIRFSPNNTVYSIGEDGQLKFWKLPITPTRITAAHGGPVTSLQLNGNNLVSGSADKIVRLWNYGNSQLTRAMTPASAAINDAAIAPNNALIAAGTEDNKLYLFNPNDGKPVYEGVVHDGPVTSVSFNTNAQQLLTASKDGLVRQWALPLKPEVLVPTPGGILAAAMTPDGARAITGGADKTVRTWTLANQKMEREFKGHAAPVTAVAISGNGQVIASGSQTGVIKLWNPGNGQPLGDFVGHTAPITSLMVQPNGQQLLSASEDGTLKLWKLPIVPAKPLAHGDQVTSAVLSPDGNRVLTGGNDKQVRLWNINGQNERNFGGMAVPPTCIAYSANQAFVAAGGGDNAIMVWNTGNGQLVKRLEKLPGAVSSVALSPDGKFVAAGLADKSIRVIDVASMKEAKAIMGLPAPAVALLYTPKGDLIVSGSDKAVQLWSPADGSNKGKIDVPAAVTSLNLTKDGNRLVIGSADKSVRVYTLNDKKLQATIVTPADIRGVDVSADGMKVLVANADNKARLFAADGKLIEMVNHAGPVTAVAYHPNGSVLISASADKNVLVTTPAVLWQGAHAGPVRQAVFNAQGNQVFSVSDDKTLKQWNGADGKELKSIAAHAGPVLGVGLSSDNNKIVTVGADKALKLWTPALDKPAGIAPLPGVPQGLTVSPNGTRAAVSYADDKKANVVLVLDPNTAMQLFTLRGATGPVPGLAFNNDNRTLFTAGADKNMRLSDIGVLAAFPAHAGGVRSVAFHNSNTQALTGGADKTVKLWDISPGKPIATLKTYGTFADPVSAVAFSRDYSQVAGAAGKTAKTWNTNDAKELKTLTHPANVTSLAFSADKTKLITGAEDGFARVWDLGTGQILELYKQAMPVRAVAFNDNNINTVSGGDDKIIGIHQLAALRVVPASLMPLRTFTLNSNGSQVLVGGDDMTVNLFNASNGNKERTYAGATAPVHAVALTKNNNVVAAGGADKIIRIYTANDAKEQATLKAPADVVSLDFSPDMKTLAAGCADNKLLTWNVAFNPGQPAPADFGKLTATYTHDGPITSVVFAPDSVHYYSASADKSVREWKFASDEPIKTFNHPNLVDAVAFDPEFKMLATGCHDGNLRLWDLEKNQPKTVAAHTKPAANPIYCVTWSNDGKLLATGSLDHSLKIFDGKTGNQVRELKAFDEKAFPKGHREGVFCAAFSPDGSLLASGSSDRSIKIWNVGNGQVVRELVNPNIKPPAGVLAGPPQSHPGWVYKLAFTPDGKYLVSVGNAQGNKGYLAIWNPADGKLLHEETLPLGPIYALGLAPDKKSLVIGCGPRGLQSERVNAYILKMPDAVK